MAMNPSAVRTPYRQACPVVEPRFRSQAEAQIGRCLARHGIDYFYEHPLTVVNHGHVRIWYPDFFLAGYGIVTEYGGRLDSPDYAAQWGHKQHVYAANGIDALMLTPADLRGDWPNRLLDRIEDILTGRVERFREARLQPPHRIP